MAHHWRKPEKPPADDKPSVIAELLDIFRTSFHPLIGVDKNQWAMPFDETSMAIRRRFTGHKHV